ncbi:branched-chain amino acid ABC transporter substrate-binding protein [Gloeobacter kilaueensis]|uniref:Extracellular ligand-binding receptor n=1 Tax=Gloeobacter kilaueensis (strain ATCC BAA-2537 / CCAP 1431/1 / ULC 316 / JS1) TaxID=1183438 RepID=U5QIY2_GLOK1|nr:branched-chain amino acid ABC transporter substrate-binding protein [Gloeobacter kilaueensis]AGY57589.1 extracellular ligand-binding receptor [Gloeobacter kilaueensis JS1]
MERRQAGFSLVALGLLLFLGGCAGERKLQVGFAGPLSGPVSPVGEDALAAARLAVDEANRRGGIKGATVELVAVDDEAKPQTAVAVAQKLVDTPEVLGVIGHLNSGCSLPASGIYHKAELAMISPGTVNYQLTEQGFANVFRVVGRDDVQGAQIARFIARELRADNVAIVHDRTAYGEGLAEFVRQNLERQFVKVSAFEGINVGDKDFRALLTRTIARKPDVLFFGGLFTEAGLIGSQARALGFKGDFVSGAGAKEQGLIDLLGKRSERTYLSGLALENGNNFSARYQKTYGHPAGPFAPYTYDATRVLLAAIAATPGKELPDRQAVVAAVARTHDFAGLGGPISFDRKGDVLRAPFAFFTIEAGHFVPYGDSAP